MLRLLLFLANWLLFTIYFPLFCLAELLDWIVEQFSWWFYALERLERRIL